MNSPTQTMWIVARNELSDSVRSRRVMVMLVLYMVGAMAATFFFIKFLQSVETSLANGLGLAESKEVGGTTATLWKSRMFRDALTHMVDDRSLAETLLAVPPLALFYGWL